MIRECGNDGEYADLLDFVLGIKVPVNRVVFLFGVIEEGIVMVINIINTDFENALSLFLVRFDKLNTDVQMVERFHAEVVFCTVVLYIGEVVEISVAVRRNRHAEDFVQVLSRIDRGRQCDSVACGEHPGDGQVNTGNGTVHQYYGDVVATVVAGEERLSEVEFVKLLLGP